MSRDIKTIEPNHLHLWRGTAKRDSALSTVKLVLAQYFANGRCPEIAKTVDGKPYLKGTSEHEKHALRFNFSHSGDRLLLGIAKNADVGVDIERIAKDRRWERIAKRFFSSSEQAQVFAAPNEDARMREFFKVWTLKEALVKALGHGIDREFRNFSAIPTANGGCRIEGALSSLPIQARWLENDAEYTSAVAVCQSQPIQSVDEFSILIK